MSIHFNTASPSESSLLDKTFSYVLENQLGSKTDIKAARKAVLIVHHTYNEIMERKVQEMAIKLDNSSSPMEKWYSSILKNITSEVLNFSKLQLNLSKTITRATYSCIFENQDTIDTLRKELEIIRQTRLGMATIVAETKSNVELFVRKQAENTPYIQQFEQKINALHDTIQPASSGNSGIFTIKHKKAVYQDIQESFRKTLECLTKESELLKSYRLTSTEPVEGHVNFLNDIINQTFTGIERQKIQSMQQQLEVLKLEPDFQPEYKALWTSFVSRQSRPEKTRLRALSLKTEISKKANEIINSFNALFNEIREESLKVAVEQLQEGKCRNMNCPNQQGEHAKELPYGILKCSRCMAVWYCSKECQKADWPIHKLICQSPTK